jgi:hypothetical protein
MAKGAYKKALKQQLNIVEKHSFYKNNLKILQRAVE